MPDPIPDTAAAVAWLKALAPTGPWLVVAINPNPEPGTRNAEIAAFSPDTEPNLVAWLDRHQGHRNLYYTSNVLVHEPFRSTNKAAVRWLRLLHVDVDLHGPADDPDEAAALIQRLRSLDPPPTAIVWTGGGVQAIWKFATLLAAPDHVARVEALNTSIWRALDGDPCHDVSRLLRLPGTVNVPTPQKLARGRVPVLAKVVDADWSRTWSYLTDSVPRPPGSPAADSLLPTGPAASPTPPPRPRGAAVAVVTDEEIGSLPVPLRKKIKDADATDFGGDRSRLGWFVICSLIRLGWSDDAIVKILTDDAYSISAHYLQHGSSTTYARRNVTNARATLAADWNRTIKGDILTKDQENVDRALDRLGVKLSYDAFADRSWVNGAGPAQRLSDEVVDGIWLRVQSECGFLPDLPYFKTVIGVRARENGYHPVLEYLERVQPTWDGRPRVGDPAVANAPSWLATYGGAEDTPYTRAVGRLILVAAVRRARQPGCKFDEMLMLVSEAQGTNKSSAIRTLAVKDEWFNDYVPIGEVGREVIEHLKGFWIIEAQEMAGMNTRELERVKSFCSRQTDHGRMSYAHFPSDVPRSCVFIGTTNDTHLFMDHYNRRYWPVIVRTFDLSRLKADLDQLWAEAARAEAAAEEIRLHPALWPVAAEVQAQFRIEDSWSTLLDEALGNLTGRLQSSDVYKILSRTPGAIQHADGRRLGRAMRDVGFERLQVRVPGSPNPKWFYLRGTPEERRRDIYVFRDPLTGAVQVTHAREPTFGLPE